MMAAAAIDITPVERALISELREQGLLDDAIATQLAEEPDRRQMVRQVMLQLVERRRAHPRARSDGATSMPVPDISHDELRGALGMIRGIQAAEAAPRGTT